MKPLPWRSFAPAEPDREYLALLTYLPLASLRQLPRFVLETLRIVAQLPGSDGLIGYSLRARPTAKQFWTLSIWRDEASLQDFVHARPHARTMTLLAPQMGHTRFVRWTLKGSEMPPRWEEALRRQNGS